MSTPPPYNASNNKTPSIVNHIQVQSAIPVIPQMKPISNGAPIMVATSEHPEACTCPHCHQSIITRVEKSNGVLVWLSSAGICLLGCVLGCCLIPFFIDGIKDTTHYCPNCNRVVGRNKKL